MNLVTLELDGFIIIVLYISLDYYIIGDTIILHNIGSLVISEPFYLVYPINISINQVGSILPIYSVSTTLFTLSYLRVLKFLITKVGLYRYYLVTHLPGQLEFF